MRIGFFAVLTCLCAYLVVSQFMQGSANAAGLEPAFENQTQAPALPVTTDLQIETFAEPLNRPWGIVAAPGLGYLVTERTGQLRVMSLAGELSGPVAGMPEVFVSGQGGLLDVTVGPDFATDRMVYFSYSKAVGDGLSVTAAARGVLAEDGLSLSDVEDIFVQDPPSSSDKHYGSRILFDGEGHLFITTGDRSAPDMRGLAQDIETTYGKVMRINPDGSVPASNPFVGREGDDGVWSYGHRNVQGAVIHPQTGQLWILEHGPRGGDELNAPVAGLNYGWPVISYGVEYSGSLVGDGITQADGMEQPRYYWSPVIAPGDLIVYQGEAFPEWQGDFLIASLSPGGVVRLEMDGDQVVGEERLFDDLGRVRDIQETPDGYLLLLSDSEDGAILQVMPKP